MQQSGMEDDFMVDTHKGMYTSMSAGSIDSRQGGPFGMTELSWADSSLTGSASMGSLRRSGMSSTHTYHLGATQRSSRSMQIKQYAAVHQAKYRWVGAAARTHSYSMSEGSTYAMYKKEVAPHMPTVGGTALSDVFRHTSEFYREGCRRLQHHGNAQVTSGRKFGVASPQSSPASSTRSPSSRIPTASTGRRG